MTRARLRAVLLGAAMVALAGAARAERVQLDPTYNTVTIGPGGSLGADFSANAPTLPNVGANFAASGPYASYVLIKTVAASPARLSVDVENLSGAQIVIVRDDGTAAAAASPANASAFALAGGQGAGAQGGSWSSTTFKGRLQIYAPSSTAFVSIMAD